MKYKYNGQWLTIPTGGGGGTTVIANPTLVGTEDNLTSIQIDDEKFKVDTTIINSGVHIHTTDEEDVESHLVSEVHLDQTQDTPVGTIVPFFGTTAPAHYLACNGSVYNISAYPDLAEFIKDEFGSYNYFGGDGTTTFGVPDLRGEFLRGAGTNSHANQGSGANVGAHQDATLLPDIFTDSNNITASGKVENQDWRGTAYSSGDVYKYTSATTYSNTKYRSTTRPTNTSILWCIKAEATYYLVNQIENATIATLDKYSTDEKCIGCWTNGKPLYRKVIISTSGDTAHTWKVIENLINADFVYIVGGYLKTVDGSRFELNSIRYNNNYSNLDYVTTQISGNNNVAIMTSSNYLNKEVICILEYTKTTDAPNSFSIDMLSNVQDLVLTAAEVQATIDAIVV